MNVCFVTVQLPDAPAKLYLPCKSCVCFGHQSKSVYLGFVDTQEAAHAYDNVARLIVIGMHSFLSVKLSKVDRLALMSETYTALAWQVQLCRSSCDSWL